MARVSNPEQAEGRLNMEMLKTCVLPKGCNEWVVRSDQEIVGKSWMPDIMDECGDDLWACLQVYLWESLKRRQEWVGDDTCSSKWGYRVTTQLLEPYMSTICPHFINMLGANSNKIQHFIPELTFRAW